MVKLFLAALRPTETAEPVIRFETGPGEQMQMDWAVIGAATTGFRYLSRPSAGAGRLMSSLSPTSGSKR